MPPSREIIKNKREKLRVGPAQYKGHDLVSIRIYAPVPGQQELVPTQKGVSINVDLVPEIIAALEWSLAQDTEAETERRLPAGQEAEEIAQAAWEALGKRGSAVHWDAAERMVRERIRGLSKWDLHYLLAKRRDLFESCGAGTFKAVGYRPSRSKT